MAEAEAAYVARETAELEARKEVADGAADAARSRLAEMGLRGPLEDLAGLMLESAVAYARAEREFSAKQLEMEVLVSEAKQEGRDLRAALRTREQEIARDRVAAEEREREQVRRIAAAGVNVNVLHKSPLVDSESARTSKDTSTTNRSGWVDGTVLNTTTTNATADVSVDHQDGLGRLRVDDMRKLLVLYRAQVEQLGRDNATYKTLTRDLKRRLRAEQQLTDRAQHEAENQAILRESLEVAHRALSMEAQRVGSDFLRASLRPTGSTKNTTTTTTTNIPGLPLPSTAISDTSDLGSAVKRIDWSHLDDQGDTTDMESERIREEAKSRGSLIPAPPAVMPNGIGLGSTSRLTAASPPRPGSRPGSGSGTRPRATMIHHDAVGVSSPARPTSRAYNPAAFKDVDDGSVVMENPGTPSGGGHIGSKKETTIISSTYGTAGRTMATATGPSRELSTDTQQVELDQSLDEMDRAALALGRGRRGGGAVARARATGSIIPSPPISSLAHGATHPPGPPLFGRDRAPSFSVMTGLGELGRPGTSESGRSLGSRHGGSEFEFDVQEGTHGSSGMGVSRHSVRTPQVGAAAVDYGGGSRSPQAPGSIRQYDSENYGQEDEHEREDEDVHHRAHHKGNYQGHIYDHYVHVPSAASPLPSPPRSPHGVLRQNRDRDAVHASSEVLLGSPIRSEQAPGPGTRSDRRPLRDPRTPPRPPSASSSRPKSSAGVTNLDVVRPRPQSAPGPVAVGHGGVMGGLTVQGVATGGPSPHPGGHHPPATGRGAPSFHPTPPLQERQRDRLRRLAGARLGRGPGPSGSSGGSRSDARGGRITVTPPRPGSAGAHVEEYGLAVVGQGQGGTSPTPMVDPRVSPYRPTARPATAR